MTQTHEHRRTFRHSDGREWSVYLDPSYLAMTVEIRWPNEPEEAPIVRTTRYEAQEMARAELQALVGEQLESGFVEHLTDDWQATLRGWIQNWHREDPSFDISPYVAQVDALDASEREACVLTVLASAFDNYRVKTGSAGEDRHPDLHARLPRIVPVVVLAQRSGNPWLNLTWFLSELGEEAVPVLWSLAERPTTGGEYPSSLGIYLQGAGACNAQSLAKFESWLDSKNDSAKECAGSAMAGAAKDQQVYYDALWARRDRADVARFVLRAISVRNDLSKRAWVEERLARAKKTDKRYISSVLEGLK